MLELIFTMCVIGSDPQQCETHMLHPPQGLLETACMAGAEAELAVVILPPWQLVHFKCERSA